MSRVKPAIHFWCSDNDTGEAEAVDIENEILSIQIGHRQ